MNYKLDKVPFSGSYMILHSIDKTHESGLSSENQSKKDPSFLSRNDRHGTFTDFGNDIPCGVFFLSP
jgi:hypothetical protein